MLGGFGGLLGRMLGLIGLLGRLARLHGRTLGRFCGLLGYESMA